MSPCTDHDMAPLLLQCSSSAPTYAASFVRERSTDSSVTEGSCTKASSCLTSCCYHMHQELSGVHGHAKTQCNYVLTSTAMRQPGTWWVFVWAEVASGQHSPPGVRWVSAAPNVGVCLGRSCLWAALTTRCEVGICSANGCRFGSCCAKAMAPWAYPRSRCVSCVRLVRCITSAVAETCCVHHVSSGATVLSTLAPRHHRMMA
jgi:hypothetical protein